MAGGSALLALAGPVGWTIGGAALVGGGLYLNSRNKKHAREATEQRLQVEAATRSLFTAEREIRGLDRLTKRYSDGCLNELDWLLKNGESDYRDFNMEQKMRLAALINNVRSIGGMINKEVAL